MKAPVHFLCLQYIACLKADGIKPFQDSRKVGAVLQGIYFLQQFFPDLYALSEPFLRPFRIFQQISGLVDLEISESQIPAIICRSVFPGQCFSNLQSF